MSFSVRNIDPECLGYFSFNEIGPFFKPPFLKNLLPVGVSPRSSWIKMGHGESTNDIKQRSHHRP